MRQMRATQSTFGLAEDPGETATIRNKMCVVCVQTLKYNKKHTLGGKNQVAHTHNNNNNNRTFKWRTD